MRHEPFRLLAMALSAFSLSTISSGLLVSPPVSVPWTRPEIRRYGTPVRTTHSSRLFLSTTSQAVEDDTIACDGLLDSETFSRYSQIHNVVHHLRTQLPTLLFQPLTTAQQDLYSSNFTLVGSNMEELASTYEELVSLSSALVAATAAARQANALVSSMASPKSSSTKKQMPFAVQCWMALDIHDFRAVRVQWNTTLPVGSVIAGLSEVHLDETGRILQHQLRNVAIDGRTVNAVGETLASLRQTIRTLNESPLLQSVRASPLAASLPVWSELRDGLLQHASLRTTRQNDTLPPVYATTQLRGAFNTTLDRNKGGKLEDLTLIDNLADNGTIPGSERWSRYAASHVAIADFVNRGLAVLSGQGTSSKNDFRQVFAADAKLLGVDGAILAEGGGRIGDFYRTLASLRKGTAGRWTVTHIRADVPSRTVTVSWMAKNPIPIKGTDRFVLRESEGDQSNAVSTIESVEQLKLVVSGSTVKDPEWFRTFFSSVEKGRSNVVGGNLLVDLLQQAGDSPKQTTSRYSKQSESPPRLSEAAAASVYGILCVLHRDYAAMQEGNGGTAPAAEYVTPSIELRGYFDETLVRGEEAYLQVANVIASSLRAFLATDRVKVKSKPKARIEFTPKGSIVVSSMLDLRIPVTQGESLALPLKLQFESEYELNEQGKIQQHRLIESRINGRLTPGDVVSRWVKGVPLGDLGGQDLISLQSIVETINWARSLSNDGSKFVDKA